MILLRLWRRIFGCQWCRGRHCICYTFCQNCRMIVLPIMRCYCRMMKGER